MPLPSPDTTANMPKVEQESPKPNIEPKVPQPQGEAEAEMVDVIDSNASNPDEALKALSKFSLKDRLISRLSRGGKTPVKVATEAENVADNASKDEVDMVASEDTQPSQDEESQTISSEYKTILDEVRQEKVDDPSGFKTLKEKVEANATPKEVPQRQFTDEDRARHQKLLALAQSKKYHVVGSLKRPEEFIKLVELLETQVVFRDSEYQEFDQKPTQEEQDSFEQKWAGKGYGNVRVFEDLDHKWHTVVEKPHPFDVRESQVPFLRELTNAGRNPGEALQALGKLRIYSLYDVANHYGSKAPKNVTNFLSSPHLLEVAQAVNRINQFEVSYDHRNEFLGQLTQFANSSEAVNLTPDLLDKVNVLSLAMQRKVHLDDLPIYERIISNGDSFNFLVAALNTPTERPISWRAPVFESMEKLQRDNLIKPLADLMQSGIYVPLEGFTSSSGIDESSESYQNLRGFAQSPEVAKFLADKDLQDFAKVVEKLTGKKNSLKTIAEASGRREGVVAFLKTATDEDRKYWREDIYSDPLLSANNFLSDNEAAGIFFNPDFQEYIARLQADTGITFNVRDYTNLFKLEDYNRTENPKSLPIELFKMRRMLELFQYEDVGEIVNGMANNHHSDEYRSALQKLKNYYSTASFTSRENVRRTLVGRLVQDSKLDIDSLSDEDFLVLGTLESFGNKDIKQLAMAEDSFPRLSPNVFSRYRMLHKVFGYQNLDQDFAREVLGYQGRLMEHGKPAKAFTDLMIKHKLLGGGIEEFLTPKVLAQYGENERIPLELLTSVPNQLQLLMGNEASFPNLSQDRLRTYTVLKDIFQYGNIDFIDNGIVDVISTSTTPEEFFRNGMPTRKLVDELINQEQFLNLPKFLTPNVLAQYDSPERKKIVNLAIGNMDANSISRFFTEDIVAQYNANERDVLRVWLDLPNDLKAEVIRETPNFPDISAESVERYRIAGEAIKKIKSSQSPEIKRLEQQIVGQLWKAENPQQALDQIISVFEKNNLPLVGKVYRVFEILHPSQELERKLIRDRNAQLSPVLTEAGSRRRYDIIYRDLLKVNIDSDNPSLYAYLSALRDGQVLADKAALEGFASLDPDSEIPQLTRFLNKMDTLYTNSLYGRRAGGNFANPASLGERVDNLRRTFNLREGESLTERVGNMFVRPLGYADIGQVIERMDEVRNNANLRNIQFYTESMNSGSGKLPLAAGDLLKGVESEYLEAFFQNGSVAKEYLGASSDSDSTPFDTDVSEILPSHITGNYSDKLDQSLAREYGDLVFVFRNRGQFQESNVDNARYDPTKYELFASGVRGENHYGIRTGIASTEIDAMFVQGRLASDEAGQERVFFDIAQSGFYIPVMNADGDILFTPEDFERYKLKTEVINEVLEQPVFNPTDLISKYKESPYLTRLYGESVGVSEGYSLERHTEMVMGQFEKYFSPSWSSPVLNRGQMRIVLSLHDLGKPLAVQVTGSTRAQHEYTMKFVPPILERLGFSTRQAEIAAAVVDQDYLGDYIKGEQNAIQTAEAIKNKAIEVGLPTKDLMELLRVYYMSDAGSYTADAGGVASLDRLFDFGVDEQGDKQVKFSTDTQEKYSALLQQVYTA